MKYTEIDNLFDKLWPICRSITGPGITESLTIIQDHVPINIVEVPSGTKAFDWIVPPEWKLNKATLHTEDGELIVSTEVSNLHVLNFSQAFNGEVTYDELEQHLYSNKEFPEAIPYVTSYYNRRWGLCISEKQKLSLKRDKKYKVNIDTEIYDGALRYGDCLLEGESDQTILISTYLCHPSLANNELSGPLAWVALYQKLSKLKRRRFTYRFIIIPETIGSIAFLANTSESELQKVYAGIVLTCLGGPSKKISFKHSRRHWLGEESDIDSFLESLCSHDNKLFQNRDFTPHGGSDERQFCSPGINLPVMQAARTVYSDYDQYHLSSDNKDFMDIGSVMDSSQKIYFFLRAFEINASKLIPEICGGEPMLGKRGLKPTINSHQTWDSSSDLVEDSREKLNLMLNIISLVDGKHRMQEIVEFLHYKEMNKKNKVLNDYDNMLKPTYENVVPIIERLIKEGIIKNV